MPQIASPTVPRGQHVYRTLQNTRSALLEQGIDPETVVFEMRRSLTQFLAEQAMEGASGPAAERTLVFAQFDAHLVMRGRAPAADDIVDVVNGPDKKPDFWERAATRNGFLVYLLAAALLLSLAIQVRL